MEKYIRNLIFVFLVVFIGCESDKDDDGLECFRCLTEYQKTACNDTTGSYGDWEEREYIYYVDDLVDDWGGDPLQFCKDLNKPSGIYCAGSCCISYHNRNVRAEDCE